MPTSPTPADRPADQLRAAAMLLRDKATAAIHEGRTTWSTGHTLGSKSPVVVDDPDQPSVLIETYAARLERVNSYLALVGPATGLAVARWLESWAGVDLSEHGPMPEDAQHALAVARQLLGTTMAAPPVEEREPIQLRWGLDDVMYGDDDTTTVLLSGPGREPYWVELDPERTAALREALAGPTAPPAPADRAAALREAADGLDRRAAVLKDLSSSDYGEESFAARELTEQADRLRRLAADAAAGVQPPTTSEALTDAERQFLTFAMDLAFDEMVSNDGFTDEDDAALDKFRALATPPAAPAAPEGSR